MSVRPSLFSAPPFSEALNLSLPRGGLSPPTVAAPLRLCVAFLANEEKALPDLPAHSLLLTEVVCDTQAKIQLIEGRTEYHFLQCNARIHPCLTLQDCTVGPYPYSTYTMLGRFTPREGRTSSERGLGLPQEG